MNVYDFDGTIYDGDSTRDFFIYVMKRKPNLLLCLPKQIWGFVLYGLKRINKTRLKEYFFCFLPEIDVERMAETFWNQNQNKIFDWYLKQRKQDDIIISASPEFLLKPLCKRLGIKYVIASKVNPETGLFAGANCRGQEKVQRLKKEYNITHIDTFYSDSYSDLPLAMIADEAFIVDKGKVKKWEGISDHV